MSNEQKSTPPGPLAGVRVIDFSIMMAGPYCTRFLADMGAEVIKVEPPEGDYIRTREPLRNGHSAYFGHINCGKRSIALDLKNPAAIEAAIGLVAKADVVVENFRPGVMKRLGLGYEKLAAVNPKLVYCAISGFGQSGPAADRPAYAQVVQASCGYDLAFMNYQDNQDRPPNSNIFLADVLASSFALSAVLAALRQRDHTGRGQFIDLALIDSMMSVFPYEFQEAQFPAKERRQVYKPVRAADGFVIICPTTPKNFETLCETTGHPEWKSDERFATGTARVKNWSELMRLVEQWTSVRPAKQCEDTFMAAGIPAATYRTIREAMQDPHFAHRGSFATVADAGGEFLVPNLPFQMSEARVQAQSYVPAIGGDTEAVLRELLGMSSEHAKALSQPYSRGVDSGTA
ncbi:MAG: carnitine dehydratase [Betaproteobacteria bacterium RIFCSPLOWO2_12_FULL_64_23]|nr:MAG: carnitine dehydratase [Betaproteobacteria bacterium RIFCSPLOWO2_12_FULL_64_23]